MNGHGIKMKIDFRCSTVFGAAQSHRTTDHTQTIVRDRPKKKEDRRWTEDEVEGGTSGWTDLRS